MAFAPSNFNIDTAAQSAEAFMSDWGSDIFRGLCVDRIEEARQQSTAPASLDDPVVVFLSEKSSQQLEEFVFKKSRTREDYLGYVMEMVQMMKQHGCQHKPTQSTDSSKNESGSQD